MKRKWSTQTNCAGHKVPPWQPVVLLSWDSVLIPKSAGFQISPCSARPNKKERWGKDGPGVRTLGVRGHFGGSGFEDVGEYGKYEIAACAINEIKSWDFFPEGWQGSWSRIILSCLGGSLEVSGQLTTGRDVRTKAKVNYSARTVLVAQQGEALYHRPTQFSPGASSRPGRDQ